MQIEPLKVLLVEDDAMVRSSLCETLELGGFDVSAFESAELALEGMKPLTPSVVICDVRLPGMDSLEFVRRVLRIDPCIPVILVTGHGDMSLAAQAMREGAYDFLEKPFPSERLVDSATRAMERCTLKAEVKNLRQEIQALRHTLQRHSVSLNDGSR